ncbi:MAG: CstA-like transporter-associated (seleno)protein [Hyphomicrobium sp.]|uniref:YbdD/YjiX family protein n=1 Tax=Hyphomicrobium sp. TaxID=82 RepID=UPI0039E522C2
MRKTHASAPARLWQTVTRTARLMVGLPDYNSYVAHRRRAHPGEPIMSYEDFFRERQTNRYGGDSGKIGRCC